MISTESVTATYLIRHGVIPEVIPANWAGETPLERGSQVVLRTGRGEELGTVLQEYRSPPGTPPASERFQPIVRLATTEDQTRFQQLQERARAEYFNWSDRIAEWKLDLQLIDLEWTLDEARLVLYVLNERGPECTKLALQAVAAGFGIVDVQPVSETGLVSAPEKAGGGGCGSCGCHS